jgi:UDP-N-acetylglucosamine--N-acetylmuramyl-(pentapeptide) pyrophosphoryl-undecaprenol N-acetylglucosamine transferase
MTSKQLTITLAAGGTGGHIFPAESLAAELIKQGHRVVLVTDRRYQKHHSTPAALEVIAINSGSSGGGITNKVKALIKICLGVVQARKILKQLKPDVVVGFGGYPSFPTMLAANFLGLRTIIHEQNSVLGRVNRILARNVNVIATSFEEVLGISDSDRKKVVLTGNPVRPAIVSLKDFPYPGLGKDEHVHLLVTGGSQGATVFSEVVPQAILSLPEQIRARIRVDQQCRAADIENVKKIYDEAGINADLATFFEDMPSRLAAAHLVIARAGASTIAELCVAGKPSILVPYMYAMDDHQTANAKAVEKRGAAVLVGQKDVTPEILAAHIKKFVENPDSLKQMAVNAFDLWQAEAVGKLAKIVASG